MSLLPALPTPRPTPPKPPAALRLVTAQVSRAQVALQSRPSLHEEAFAGLAQLAEGLSTRLDLPLSLEAELLPGQLRASQLRSPSAFALLSFRTGGRGLLELEGRLATALVARLAGVAQPAAVTRPLSEGELAATELLLLDLLVALETTPLAPWAPRLESVVGSAAQLCSSLDLRRPHVALAVRLRSPALQGELRLILPAAEVHRRCATATTAALPLDARLGARGCALSLVAGHARLTAADWAALDAGDVVLLDDLQRVEGALTGPARLHHPAFTLLGQLGRGGLTFHAATRPESAMKSSDTVPNLKAVSLPIELEVQLARVRLPLSELHALEAGKLLPLHLPLGEPVVLRMDGQDVALAELVDIEGEVGARVLRLLA